MIENPLLAIEPEVNPDSPTSAHMETNPPSKSSPMDMQQDLIKDGPSPLGLNDIFWSEIFQVKMKHVQKAVPLDPSSSS